MFLAAALLAQAAGGDLATILQWVNTGGSLTTITIGAYILYSGRVVPRYLYDAKVGECAALAEEVRLLHREAAQRAQDTQDKVIPALVDATLAVREARRG